MAFTVRDYQDLVQLLAKHPEWQAELRRLLLADDFLALPAIVRDLAQAQKRTEQRVAELAEAQKRSEERLTRLETAVAQLAEAQQRTEQRVAELAEAQKRSEERLTRLEIAVAELADAQKRTEQHLEQLVLHVDQLAQAQQRVWDKLGRLDGRMLEAEYRDKIAAYLSRLLYKTRLVTRENLADALEGRLTLDNLHDVLLTDVVVRGQVRQRPEAGEVWLAIEVSVVVDERDVTRAGRRADLLGQAGLRAIPVVAGESATPEAELEARRQSVVMLQDGQISLWDEAMARQGSVSI
jgi:hypothetical protein